MLSNLAETWHRSAKFKNSQNLRSLTQKTKIWWHYVLSRRFGKYSFKSFWLSLNSLKLLVKTVLFQDGTFSYCKNITFQTRKKQLHIFQQFERRYFVDTKDHLLENDHQIYLNFNPMPGFKLWKINWIVFETPILYHWILPKTVLSQKTCPCVSRKSL